VILVLATGDPSRCEWPAYAAGCLSFVMGLGEQMFTTRSSGFVVRGARQKRVSGEWKSRVATVIAIAASAAIKFTTGAL